MSARSRGVKPDAATCLGQGFPGMSGCSLHNLKCMRTLAALRETLLPKLMSGELRVSNLEKMVRTEA